MTETLNCLTRLLFACAFFAIVQCSGYAQGGSICRVFKLSGLEREDEVGHMLVGHATSDRSKVNIYITVAQGQLYVQSNYVAPGSAFPTKAVFDTKYPLDIIVLNILAKDEADEITKPELDTAIRDQIHFFVDRFRIDQSPFSEIDFSAAGHVIWDPQPPQKPTAVDKAFDPKTALAQPGIFPVKATLREPPQSGQPKSISEGIVALLWQSLYGKFAFALLAITAGLVAVWTTFPDSVKERILGRFLPAPHPQTDDKSVDPKHQPPDAT